MKIASKPYGLIEVDERQMLTFPHGLLGFEDHKDYVLMDAERQPFYWLQSTELESLAFILINPFVFRADYEVNLDDEEFQEIGIDDPQQALIFSIVTIPPAGGLVTANLQGPLIINRETRIGKQVILQDSRWNIRHDIIAEMQAQGVT
ncbi:MAG: flagellar assembly protein FliW [Treponema sp.]|jgi:flagellar assembly factor FliW|nr:flagellar assembly protein FliW [Treponema sp.]